MRNHRSAWMWPVAVLLPLLAGLVVLAGLPTDRIDTDPTSPGPAAGSHGVGESALAGGPARFVGSAAASPARATGTAGLDENGNWHAGVCRVIEEREYHASENGQGLQAPNRAQGFRTYFRNDRVEVIPRCETPEAWCWTWSTKSFGRLEPARADAEATADSPSGASRDRTQLQHPVRSSQPVACAARVEYPRGGWCEWYDNGREGLEQGFTLFAPPPGSGEVCLVGAIGGDVTARAGDASGSVVFREPAGAPVLTYGKLVARDAAGRELPSRLEVQGPAPDGRDATQAGLACEIRILVDDRDALYPLHIDPLLQTPEWEILGGQAGATLGASAATAGDVDGDGRSDFVVSAPSFDAGETDEGIVLLFRGRTYLDTEPDWTAEGGQAGAHFGECVSTAGDVNGDGYHDLLISAPMYVEDGGRGRVYCYLGSSGGLGASPSWYARTAGLLNTEFGRSVATAGDVNGDGFDDILIGAPLTDAGLDDEGCVWLYQGSAAGLSTTPAWMAGGNQVDCHYGHSVAGAGDVNADGYADVVVGAPYFDTPLDAAGRVFLYRGSAAGLSTVPIVRDGLEESEDFGWTVAGAGDVNGDGYAEILVGVPYYCGGFLYEGRACLFYGQAAGIEAAPSWVVYGEQASADCGESVATAGDVNGDGLSDVIVGCPGAGEDEDGRAKLYYGARGGLPVEPGWEVAGGQFAAGFGDVVTTAGDVNGDGYSDLLVAAPHHDGTAGTAEGRAALWLGAALDPKETPGWVIESNQASASFGAAVANAGDVNGDGYDDILVGAPFYDNGQTNEGAAFLFCGHGAGTSVLPDWWAESNQAYSYFARSLAGPGDVNGDGYDDVLIGAGYYDSPLSNEGTAFLWLGTPGAAPSGNPTNSAWRVAGGRAEAAFGWTVNGAGDVNGDGFADVAIGAPAWSNGEVHEGQARVYLGSADGLAITAAWTKESNVAAAYYGNALSSAGDVNGDGYSELLVGAPYQDWGIAGEGLAFIYVGSSAGLSTIYGWYARGNQPDAHFGWSVACAGDVNADGFSDFVIGAPEYDHGSAWDPLGCACAWLGAELGPSGHTPEECDDMSWIYWEENAQAGYAVAGGGDYNADGYADIVIGSRSPDHQGAIMVIPGWSMGLQQGNAVVRDGAQTGGLFGSAVAMADVNGDGFSDILVGAPGHDEGQTDEGRGFIYYANNRGLPRAPDQKQIDFAAPIGRGGNSRCATAFGLSALGRTAAGRGQVRMEWLVRPFGDPLGSYSWISGSLHDTGAPVSGSGSAVAIQEVPDWLDNDQAYHWHLRLASNNPFFPRTPWFSPSALGSAELHVRTAGVSAGTGEPQVASTGLPLDCRPNPFRGETTIRWELLSAGSAHLEVVDVQGRVVRTIAAGPMSAGSHWLAWNGRGDDGRPLASGVYWLRMRGGERETKMRVVRID